MKMLAATVVLGAALVCCGASPVEDEKPPPKPSSRDLARLASETRQPAYWLGPRYRGLDVSHASAAARGVNFTYGEWSCSPGSGCTDSGNVFTGPRRVDLDDSDFEPAEVDLRDCWARVGNAVAVLYGCDPLGYPHELEIFTGDRRIYMTSIYLPNGTDEVSSFRVARSLKPLNGRAPWPLAKPARFSCRELARVGPSYRKHMPKSLAPRRACR